MSIAGAIHGRAQPQLEGSWAPPERLQPRGPAGDPRGRPRPRDGAPLRLGPAGRRPRRSARTSPCVRSAGPRASGRRGPCAVQTAPLRSGTSSSTSSIMDGRRSPTPRIVGARPRARRRAVDLACVFRFEQLGLARVQVLTDADNVASRKVAAKGRIYGRGLPARIRRARRKAPRHSALRSAPLRPTPRL